MKQKINMHAGTLEWNGSDLTRIGKPRLRIVRQADPPSPALATRMLVSLTVTVELEARDPGTIQARAQWLAESMRVPEGILRSTSGSGHQLEWLCVPGDHNLADAMRGASNAVELNFSCVEPHGESAISSLTSASFTPTGSSQPLVLHALRDISEEIRTNRHAERASARSATTTTLRFTARVAQANPAEPLGARQSYLQAQAQAVKALDTREGTLTLGTRQLLVRVTEFTPAIDDRCGTLDVQVQCYHVTLPDIGVAECLHDTDTRTDEGTGEEVISLKGTIEASTRGIALAKLETLRNSQLAPGKRLVSFATQDKTIDGFDTAGVADGDWTGALTYTMELRKARTGGHHTLRIATRRDVRSGMRWSYSGTVNAADAASALATARAIAAEAAAQHPLLVSSEETLDLATGITNPAARNFIKLDFSYEFEGASDGFIAGEITTETTQPLAGEWRRSINGFLVAINRDTAEARLAILLGSDNHALEATRRWSDTYLDDNGSGDGTGAKTLCARLEFTSVLRTARLRTVVEYTDTTEWDSSSMQQTRTISGTVWAANEAVAEASIPVLTGTSRGSRSHTKVTIEGDQTYQWVKLEFSASATTWMAGRTAWDLREASSSVTTVDPYQATVVTPIPFSTPIVQKNVGLLPGRRSASATAKALNAATAAAWVNTKLAAVTGSYIIEPRSMTLSTEESLTPDGVLNETLHGASGSIGYGI